LLSDSLVELASSRATVSERKKYHEQVQMCIENVVAQNVANHTVLML
jgi:hypothetical protein